MIEQISGYKTFVYAESFEHAQRIQLGKQRVDQVHSAPRRLLFHIGKQLVRFGSWLIQRSALPERSLQTMEHSHSA